ncbi:potassium/proton antiporter [Anaerofustis stercorihominis]|uniref:Potassium/proton antiporter n=1 Tax=Anaerofustis stercorihominis TaxID=214853 RepID=A0A3E3DUQ7_9FIRM|nr:potassium/proton antiporter [Anaerofustis stercorihominis]RGD73024.1 potassium/proton antiporter [Anaerofustis stercorihominis]
MTFYLLISALVIILCLFCNKLSNKIGLPALLIFIGIGVLFGSDGIFKIYFDDYNFAETVCSVALIFIMFFGGFCTNWNIAKPVINKAVSLSTLGVILTAFLVALFSTYVFKFDFLTGLLIGSLLSSTDAASVFSILRLHKLNLKNGLASILEIESGSNDPFAFIMTMLTLTLMGVGSHGSIITFIFKEVIFGLIIGVLIGLAGIYILSKVDLKGDGLDTIFVFALALSAYALPVTIGGNGYLSVYISGLMLGNSNIKNKISLVHFFNGITGLAQMIIFFILGLLSFPGQLPEIFLTALLIMLFLTFIARPIVVFIILKPFKVNIKQILFISFSGLRGAASIVFAIIVIASGAKLSIDIYHIVFLVAIFSILFQGTLLPYVAKKLDVVDNEEDVFKTFTDYNEVTDMELVQIKVTRDTDFLNKKLCDLSLPKKMLIVMIKRGEDSIVPNGNTMLREGDIIIFNAKLYNDDDNIKLKEVKAEDRPDWINKSISEITFKNKRRLIVMIKRGEKTVIPRGNTKIRKDDILVLSGFDE